MKKPRKRIRQMGWGVKWKGWKTVEFFHSKSEAKGEMEYFNCTPSLLFRCKIEEVAK